MGLIRTNCVVVNYNDADTTECLVKKIHDYQSLKQIVVVDNGSSDGSWERLKLLQDEKVAVIHSERNGGYGYGNNLGVKYAMEINEATHVVIANPDVEFADQTVVRMANMFKNHPDVGIVSAVMEDMQYGGMGYGWKLHGFFGELLAMGPVSRRVFGRFLNYPQGYFKGKKAVYVDVVHGSMLMVDTAAFMECGGYDEKIFLYQEEAVLAWRMKTSGYRTVLLLTDRYIHHHGTSVGKSLKGQLKRQSLRHESLIYYLKNYLYINRAEETFARLWFQIILLEIRMSEMAQKIFAKS